MDKENVATKEYYPNVKKWNLAICNNMDAPWGYYATQNTFDTERQILICGM